MAESVRLKLLAYDQGNYDALFWYLQEYIPPKPYQWKVGMSKRQVLNSVAGEPRRIIKRSTDKGTSETWIYDGAYLFFGGVHDKFDALKEIQEIK